MLLHFGFQFLLLKNGEGVCWIRQSLSMMALGFQIVLGSLDEYQSHGRHTTHFTQADRVSCPPVLVQMVDKCVRLSRRLITSAAPPPPQITVQSGHSGPPAVSLQNCQVSFISLPEDSPAFLVLKTHSICFPLLILYFSIISGFEKKNRTKQNKNSRGPRNLASFQCQFLPRFSPYQFML